MKKIFGVLLLICSIGILLWFYPVSISFGEKKVEEKKVEEKKVEEKKVEEKKVEEKKIGLMGLYLNDNIVNSCNKLKELVVQFPAGEYKELSFNEQLIDCSINKKGNENNSLISVMTANVVSKEVVSIQLGKIALNHFYKKDQYSDEDFMKMIANELKLENIKKTDYAYESINNKLNYVFTFIPSNELIDFESKSFVDENQKITDEKAEALEASIKEREKREVEKKIGFKGLYLDDNIETACNKMKELSLQFNGLVYVNTSTSCGIREKRYEKFEYDHIDYVTVKSKNQKVNEIIFNYDGMQKFLNPENLNADVFSQLLVDTLPWLKTLKPITGIGKEWVGDGAYRREVQRRYLSGYANTDGVLGYSFFMGVGGDTVRDCTLKKLENNFN